MTETKRQNVCSACKWYKTTEEGERPLVMILSECHLHPTKVRVNSEHWCGQFEEKDKVKYKIIPLAEMYDLENPGEIWNFLLKHDHLFEKLEQIYFTIYREFCCFNNTCLSLKHITDPEEHIESLSVKIETDLSPRKAIDRLNKFDEWWLDEDSIYKELISISV